MEMLFVFVGLIGLPVMAASGTWYRGAYLAVAVLGGLLTLVFGQQPVGHTAATADIDLVTMALLSMSIGTAIGGVLGACLYRKPSRVNG